MKFYSKLASATVSLTMISVLLTGVLPVPQNEQFNAIVYAEDSVVPNEIPDYAQQTINEIEAIVSDGSLTTLEKANKVQGVVNKYINMAVEKSTLEDSFLYMEGSLAILKELRSISDYYNNETMQIESNTNMDLIRGFIPLFRYINADQAYKIYNDFWEITNNSYLWNGWGGWWVAKYAAESICEIDINYGGTVTADLIDFDVMNQRLNKINSDLAAGYYSEQERVKVAFAIKANNSGDEAKVTLLPEIAELLKQNGIENIPVKTTWGAIAAVPFTDITKDITIGFKKGSAVAGSNERLSVNAPVFQFSFTQNGQPVSLPNSVTLSIPSPQYNGNYDPEKLAVYTLKAGNWVPFYSNEKYNNFMEKYLEFKSRESGSFSVLFANKYFNDIYGHWAAKYISDMYARGIINGVNNTTFDPERNVTRAEFAKMLVRTLGIELENYTSIFVDVKTEDWFAQDVATAYKYGLVTGVTKDYFEPNRTITREEMATMLVRAMKMKYNFQVQDLDATLKPYTDQSQIADYAREPMTIAIEQSMINGVTGNTLAPQNNTTRAQATTVMYRFYNNVLKDKPFTR